MKIADFLVYTLLLAVGVALFLVAGCQWDFIALLALTVAVLGGSHFLTKRTRP